MEYVETLGSAVVPPSFVEKVPVQFARNYYLVGLDQANGAMRVATASPFDAYPMDDLAAMLGLELEPVLAPRTEITSLINKAYRNKQDIVEESIGEFRDEDLESLAEDAGRQRGHPRRRQQGPDHQARQHALLPGAEDAGLGHPPAAVRGPPAGAVPDRRHPVRHGVHPEEDPGRGHEPHQGAGQARHRRAAPPAGRPRRRSSWATPRSTSASRSCRPTTASGS